ncbi:unnamed protein product [Rotaria sp. Silwood1]|nr:unnamed protein product [Rotaria sp. Silwood1]CAF0941397.1 unnamed protein product [Rotaria sp. Silwood1]CAF3394230.1 unnamed protein product [Rotaria sp. Silwood1]CAF3397422.1 unnamed protein product [Rotaria sp. Silwood1]CAF3398087.1 unnamed protein product [Rotaria sp. Silwood1]
MKTNFIVKQALADRGAERELMMIKIDCYSCSWNGLYNDYKEHLGQIHAYLECSNCHKHFFSTNLYEEHLQELCENRSVQCGLPGCIERIKWSEIGKHFLCETHQKILLEVITQYFFLKKCLANNVNCSTTTFNVVSNIEQELTTVQENINTLLPGVENSLNNCARLKSEHDQIKATCDNLTSQRTTVRKMIQDGNEITNKYIQEQNEMEKQIDHINKLQIITKTFTLDSDSTATFAFIKHSHEMNVPFSIYSPRFKTSQFGYCFMIRVCSTIISENENQEYLSIYITLLRGEFDPILLYPFPYNIYLCLCDQSNQRKHIVSIIKADANKLSFMRPTSEKNDEVGIIKFCPLNFLKNGQNNYLKDDIFFIRIFIDFMNNGINPFNVIIERSNIK